MPATRAVGSHTIACSMRRRVRRREERFHHGAAGLLVAGEQHADVARAGLERDQRRGDRALGVGGAEAVEPAGLRRAAATGRATSRAFAGTVSTCALMIRRGVPQRANTKAPRAAVGARAVARRSPRPRRARAAVARGARTAALVAGAAFGAGLLRGNGDELGEELGDAVHARSVSGGFDRAQRAPRGMRPRSSRAPARAASCRARCGATSMRPTDAAARSRRTSGRRSSPALLADHLGQLVEVRDRAARWRACRPGSRAAAAGASPRPAMFRCSARSRRRRARDRRRRRRLAGKAPAHGGHVHALAELLLGEPEPRRTSRTSSCPRSTRTACRRGPRACPAPGRSASPATSRARR